MKLIKQLISNEQVTGEPSLGSRIKQLAIISLALVATSLPVTTWSAEFQLANSPLFMKNRVQPNVFFLMDDSGSMGWEVLKTPRAVALHSGYPNSGNIDLTPDNTAERLELCTSYNALAYVPGKTYAPWKGLDTTGNPYPNMTNLAAVRRDPYNTATSNLTNTTYIAYFPWTDTNNDNEYNVGECGPNNNSAGITINSLSPAEKLEYMNWYSYYRKRQYVMKFALGEVISKGQQRMGLGTLWNNNGVGIPIQDIDDISLPVNTTAATNKRALLRSVGRIRPSGSTPLRRKLQDVGEYYDGTRNSALFGATYNYSDTFSSRSPILNQAKGGECQQNYTIALTDGDWNGSTPSPSLGNVDGSEPDPYKDSYSNTMADVAMFYYNKDLAPPLADLVPQFNRAVNPDLNIKQHMVTYTIAFGLKGEIKESFPNVEPDDAAFPGWPNPFTGTSTQRKKRRIDDVWHAAYNGRGSFISAGESNKLSNDFQAIFDNISARTGSAAGVSVTSGTVSSTTRIYQTKFTSDNWAGQLLAYKFIEDPAIIPPAPPVNIIVPANDFVGATTNDARIAMEAQIIGGASATAPDNTDARTILTYNGTKGIPFRYDSTSGLGANTMTAAQVTTLVDGDVTSGGLPDNAKAQRRVEYLRGDHYNEVVNRTRSDGSTNANAVFRTRDRDPSDTNVIPFVLGDTVHSSPLYVGAPPFAYPDFLEGAGNAYNNFKLNYFNRTPIIYFGANDGMLHGVDANTGEEKLAYAPSMLYKNLPALTSTNYRHTYYVDESPAVGDVFYNGAWNTVLVGALRAGGQGIFALNITDPSTFSETTPAPANTVLWEFTDADDRDLGYTYGRPAIVKMSDERWYAIFSNGYNNTEADGNASTTGNAVLYIVDIETKAVTKINTGRGMSTSVDGSHPNGLAKPAIVDYDGDYRVDYIYAGDLQGNMWKFDVTGNKATWSNASNRSILFTATDPGGAPQPITTEPEIEVAPNGPQGFIVIFGTGQYIEVTDIVSTQTQTMYGIWDQSGYSGVNTVNVARNELVSQTLTFVNEGGRDLRLNTNNLITKWGSGGGTGEYMGWKIDLPETRERIVTNPVIQDDKIIFISITPNDEPCSPGGTSWFMVLDLDNGGRTDESVIDVNQDGVIGNGDKTLAKTVVSGVRKNSLILNSDVSVMDDVSVSGSSNGQKCSSAATSRVITSDSKGDLGGTTLSRPQNAFRQGWRQLQ